MTGRGLFSRFEEIQLALQIDGDQLRDAALGHGDAVEAVHAGHGHAMVSDDDEAGLAGFRHLLERRADTIDVRVIKRRVNLVENADRGRVGQEHREQQSC